MDIAADQTTEIAILESEKSKLKNRSAMIAPMPKFIKINAHQLWTGYIIDFVMDLISCF
jgi:hypothetical protein